jgi:hypothetical protein
LGDCKLPTGTTASASATNAYWQLSNQIGLKASEEATPHVEQPQPRNIQRADIAPTDRYALVVDGHFKDAVCGRGSRKKVATELLCDLSNVASRNLPRIVEVTSLG